MGSTQEKIEKLEKSKEEWKKLLLKGRRPSRGLEILRRTGLLRFFPELGALVDVPQDPEWLSGRHMTGVWYETEEDASRHQQAMSCVPHGRYQAMAVSPLAAGRLDPPDIALLYATPGQMIMLISGLQWSGYKKLEFGCVGESACADSWGRALATREPSLSIPCFAERLAGLCRGFLSVAKIGYFLALLPMPPIYRSTPSPRRSG